MKKKLVALCAIMLLASGCGKVPKLDNGKDAIVSFKNGEKISVYDFYSKLKDDMGLNTLITMIDTYICETEFKDYKDTASKNAQAYIDAFIEQYGGKDKFLEALHSQTNYQTIDAYQNYLYLANLQSHAIEEYAKTKITDKEIKAYYDDEAIGDMEINHILITADVKEDITEVFTKLAKEYSKDDSTKDKGGSLGKINLGDLDSKYDELLNSAKKLKDGEYSTSVITTELGYHVILKVKSYEKDTLDNLKDKIVETLADRYITKNKNSIGLNALQHYRKEYGMEIQDDEIKKQYSNYIQNSLASIASASQSTTK